MGDSMYDNTPTSRFEEGMRAMIDGTPWPDRPPKSKMESLLKELNDTIKEGGGGGGGTSTIAWKPTVAADGTISWVRTASETKPEDQNIKGPKGDTGETGAKGDTGETGPQGPKGDDGDDGDPGLGIKLVSINQQGHLIITFDDDTTQDAGAIPGGGGAVDSVNGQTGVVVLDAEDVGALPDDTTIPTKTSDLTNDSGFQTASDVAAAISGKVDTSAVGTTVASLTDGKVPASQLPSYVDDVIEAEDVMHFPVTGESGKIYVALDTNKTYRWSGSGYVEISESLALGETSSTAYAGNKGKANADAIDAIKDGTTIDSFSDVESALAGKANSATTLAGYGITDAYTKSSVDTALALKADKSELPDVATASDVGLVKPDGTTVTVDANGVLTAVGGGGSSDPYDGRKVRYTISSSGWSSSPNSDGYYTYSLTLTNPLTTSTSPNVYIAGASDSTQPTATEHTMFGYVKRCNLSSSTTLVLYATTKPTSTFYVFVGAEGGSIPKVANMTAPTPTSDASERYTYIKGGYCVRDGICYVDLTLQLNYQPSVVSYDANPLQYWSSRFYGFPLVATNDNMPLFDVSWTIYNSGAHAYDVKGVSSATLFADQNVTSSSLILGILCHTTFDASNISNHLIRCHIKGQYEV